MTTPDLTPTRIAQIREDARAATEGEWFYDSYSHIVSAALVRRVNEEEAELDAEDANEDDPRWEEGTEARLVTLVRRGKDKAHRGDARFDPQTQADGIYIANLDPPTAIAMCGEIERLRLLLMQTRNQVSAISAYAGEREHLITVAAINDALRVVLAALNPPTPEETSK